MPTYSYKCEECNTRYEVFHKVREESDSIKCPTCNSHSYRKVMSAASIGGVGTSGGFDSQASYPSCGSGGCAGGMCGLN